jgi:hypothetical protein
MADSRWETAADEELDKALLDLSNWVTNMEKIWGPEWAKHWREKIEQQRKAGPRADSGLRAPDRGLPAAGRTPGHCGGLQSNVAQ